MCNEARLRTDRCHQQTWLSSPRRESVVAEPSSAGKSLRFDFDPKHSCIIRSDYFLIYHLINNIFLIMVLKESSIFILLKVLNQFIVAVYNLKASDKTSSQAFVGGWGISPAFYKYSVL